MKYITLFNAVFALLCLVRPIKAQDQQRMIQETIDQLFNSMRKGDSTMACAVFTKSATLTSLSHDAEGKLVRHQIPAKHFITAIGTPHKEQWNEQIYNITVHIDEPMAVAWVPYKFHLGSKFLHCGVNAISLELTEDGWKISAITDTRKTPDCAN